MSDCKTSRVLRGVLATAVAWATGSGEALAVDAVPPLVLVHVRVAEVQRSQMQALGIDWGAQPFRVAERGLGDLPGLAALFEGDGSRVLTRPSAITTSGRQTTIEIGGEPSELRDLSLTFDLLPTVSGDRRYIRLETVLRIVRSGQAPAAPRTLENHSRLENGGSLVIAGQIGSAAAAGPALGNLPLVGNLFSRDTNAGPSELIVLITPWVTNPDGGGRSVGPHVAPQVHRPKPDPHVAPDLPNQPPGGPRYPHGPSDRVRP